jgi:hypothetical protein
MRPGERRRFVLRDHQAAAPPVGRSRQRLASLPAVAASQRRCRLSFQRMLSQWLLLPQKRDQHEAEEAKKLINSYHE